VDYLNQSLTITRRGEPESEGLQMDEVVQKTDPLETQLKSFVRSVRERTPPVVSGEDGQRALEVALQIATVIGKTMEGRR
jgi:predicted dehydrogenase